MGQNLTSDFGERLSFFKLFSQKQFKIVIPIIQRDYAQGRTDEQTTEVRSDFLDALYGYLNEGVPNRDLDFVYGTLQSDDEDEYTNFIPLDGQQRLTTLFLLHWFLYQIQEENEEGNLLQEAYRSALLTDNGQSKFTYKTRQSSTDFCNALMQSVIDMNNLIEVEDKNGKRYKSLAGTIKNEPWYFRIWNNDPTIQSMLVMLDAIYKKFMGHPEFLKGLMDEENPTITFIYKDLNKYRLTDDLYIKMNSRGKPLTRYENFKAKFEQYIKKLMDEEPALKAKRYRLKYADSIKEVDFHQYFSFNIDTKWTTLFWQYCKGGKETNLDTYIENYIRVILTCHYASVNKLSSDNTLEILTSTDPNLKSLSFSKYESTKALNADALIMLVDSLDALYNNNDKIKPVIPKEYSFYFNEEAIFGKVIKNDLSRNERIQFYAYIQFLIQHKGDTEGIEQWMRVVHNLTHPDNSIIDSNADMVRAMHSIKNLLPYSKDILTYIQNNDFDGFTSHQIREERVKARIFAIDGWKQCIENIEKHSYFNGQIGFLLEFSGINVSSFDFDNVDLITADALELFKKYSTIASHIFELNDKGIRHNDVNYCFERAVLRQGNYLMGASSDRYNLLSTETVARNVKRDSSWKRFLRISDYDGNRKRKNYVKQVFDQVHNLEDITNEIKSQCIPDSDSQWRNILIETPELLQLSEKGYIAMYDNQVIVLRHWFSNSYHVELYTYHLWLRKFRNRPKKLFFCSYEEQKTWEIVPYIYGYGLTYKKNRYHFYIDSVIKSNYELDHFLISFAFDNAKRDDYPEELAEILSGLNFKRSDSDNSFQWKGTAESSIMTKLNNLEDALVMLMKK